MPRYHFNVFDDDVSLDFDGIELPDVPSAKREAVILAGATIEGAGKSNKIGDQWRLEVTDDKGLILYRIEFTISDLVAARGKR